MLLTKTVYYLQLYGTLLLWVSRTGTVGWTEHWVYVPKCALTSKFLASNSLHNQWLLTMGAKNCYAHITIQRILNKYIKINFSRFMFWLCCCLFQDGLPVKILMTYLKKSTIKGFCLYAVILNFYLQLLLETLKKLFLAKCQCFDGKNVQSHVAVFITTLNLVCHWMKKESDIIKSWSIISYLTHI